LGDDVTSIGSYAFNGCSGLTSVYIPSSVKTIGNNAFAKCTELLDVYCYARKSPTMGTDAFANSGIQFATLYVPEASLNGYKVTEPWSGFGDIKTLSGDYPIQKCSTPTISYVDGKLTFSCDTEGATCQYSITDTDIKAGSGNEVQLTTTYKVTVYATKDGYENSDIVTQEINVSGGSTAKKGDVNEDGQVNGTDIQEVINIIVNAE
jgi:hypothetical protein